MHHMHDWLTLLPIITHNVWSFAAGSQDGCRGFLPRPALPQARPESPADSVEALDAADSQRSGMIAEDAPLDWLPAVHPMPALKPPLLASSSFIPESSTHGQPVVTAPPDAVGTASGPSRFRRPSACTTPKCLGSKAQSLTVAEREHGPTVGQSIQGYSGVGDRGMTGGQLQGFWAHMHG